MKKDNRFEIVEHEGSQLKDSGLLQVIVDKETGVNYLWIKSGYAGGLTPLLDVDGKPIISK
ncbi:MAG: xylan 1,4-beta-xylosidase [Lachnospiraceae bacterium]|nr:xylan 1,4-beta-xylosidase [Lachnospiraceae bacterium]